VFTGIVRKVGRVASAERSEGALRLRIETGLEPLELGESIAVNGACLTVAGPRGEFFVSQETLARTALGSLVAGSPVNLERALEAGGRLSGHIVQGHVDGVGRLESVREAGGAREARFRLGPGLGRYCVEKGSIALDGVSLTINSVDGDGIGVMLVPHTWENTTFARLRPGDPVNVEVDILAKYTEKLCQPYLKP
jgi:riboflavin synthase